MSGVITNINLTKKGSIKANYERLKKALAYIKNKLIDWDGNMNLTIDLSN